MSGKLENNISRRDFIGNSAKLFLQAGLTSLFLSCFNTESSSNEKSEGESPDLTPPGFEPAYLKLHKSGELKERASRLWQSMSKCSLCPRSCGVNRIMGMTGFCRSPGTKLVISGAHAHFGEERPLVGRRGSGTIFFSHCSLRCAFCQNWSISHLGRGSENSIYHLSEMMLRLQRRGCHNINLVTPTHYAAHIIRALDIAAGKGLTLPLVYNTCGWETMELLKELDGIVDIYMPDFKYWDGKISGKLSAGAECYPDITRSAILEMDRQVGVIKTTNEGIMLRGLIIRHLVMPNNIGGSEDIMVWIAENLPKNTFVNIMAQYTPAHKAYDFPKISRRINSNEYRRVVDKAREMGLTNLDIQGYWWLR